MEFISAAYHAGSDVLSAGAQDNQGILSYPPLNVVTSSNTIGYSAQQFASGDGGYTHIDTASSTYPKFYLSAQNLGGLGFVTQIGRASCRERVSSPV